MVDFIRTLSITISVALFTTIPKLYTLFYGLASMPSLFETDQIKDIINNIYTITSVVMLFAFATKAISGIVNPDNLWDNKKGVTGVLKRSLIGLVLIVAIPFGFEYFYEFQTKIITNGIIEKFLIGISYNKEDLITEEEQEEIDEIKKQMSDEKEKEEYQNSVESQAFGYRMGQVLAQKAFKSVVKSAEGYKCTSSNIDNYINFPIESLTNAAFPTKMIKSFFTNIAYIGINNDVLLPTGKYLASDYSLCEYYDKSITENISYSKYLIAGINETTKFDLTQALTGTTSFLHSSEYYIFHMDYWGLVAVLVGGIIVYMLVIFCIDSAVRLIKLSFLQITAPISIMAYIAGGNEMLKKWWNEVLGTLISLFLRIAAISFLVLVLIYMDDFVSNVPSYYDDYARVFIIIGALIFVKKVPELVEKIAGVKLNLQGGIGGRLGQMAGVGKVAQNAWKSLGSTAKGVGATALGFGLGALGTGAKFGAKKFDKKVLDGKGQDLLNQFNESNGGRYIKAGASAAKSGVQAGGGMKSIKAVSSSWKGNEDVKALKAEGRRTESQAILDRYRSKQDQTEYGRNKNLLEGQVRDANGNVIDLGIKTPPTNATSAQKTAIKNQNHSIQQNRILEAERGFNSRENSLKNESRYTDKVKDRATEYFNAMDDKTILEDAKTKRQNMITKLENIQNRTNDAAAQNLISSMIGDINAGKLDDSLPNNMKSQIQKLFDMNIGMATDEANKLIQGVTAYNDYIGSSAFESAAKKFGFEIKDSNGNIKSLAQPTLNRIIDDSDKQITVTKDNYEQQKNKDIKLNVMTEEDGKALDYIVENSQITTKEYVSELSKKNKFNDSVINNVNPSSTGGPTPSPTGPMPTGGSGGPAPSGGAGGTGGTNPQQSNSGSNQTAGSTSGTSQQANNGQGINGQTLKVDNITTNNIDAQTVKANQFSTNTFSANQFNADNFSTNNNPINNQNSSSDSSSSNNDQDIIDAINDVKDATQTAGENVNETLGQMKEQDRIYYNRDNIMQKDQAKKEKDESKKS